jgi:hypothetical protein
MQGPRDSKLRGIDGVAQDRSFIRSRREAIAVKPKRFSVVSGGLPMEGAPSMDTLHYLRELESENIKLRGVAVTLALEISALRGN